MTTRKKVAIIGGGPAGLTAAWYLCKTHDVTVYSLGWRLGGKLASSYDVDDHDRNLEHGLHVWFGFYDNAFRMTTEVYAELSELYPDWPYPLPTDAFAKQSFTPLGEEIEGEWKIFPMRWPENDLVPGTGGLLSTGEELVLELLELFQQALQFLFDLVDPLGMGFLDRLRRRVLGQTKVLRVFTGASSRLDPFKGFLEGLGFELAEAAVANDVLEAIQVLVRLVEAAWELIEGQLDPSDVNAHMLECVVEVGLAFLRGLINPAYQIPQHGWDLDRINHLEFRQWLIDNGCDPTIAANWAAIQALYQTGFFFAVGGDTATPQLEAGTAARIMIRICLTYKGAVLYLPNAGLGELFAGAMYTVMKEKYGVQFKLFHKLSSVEVDDSGTGNPSLTSLTFTVQAEARKGTEYDPVIRRDNGLWSWPSEPYWDQLKWGSALQKAEIDFESHWYVDKLPPRYKEGSSTVTVGAGKDHDLVISAMSLGSFKRLNEEEPSCLDAALNASPALSAAAEQLPIVPTVAAQLWFKRDLAGLGWTEDPPAMVGWATPLDIWADMTAVVANEGWGAHPPRTLAYLCGVLETNAYTIRPASAVGTPSEALKQVQQDVETQLNDVGASVWPGAVRGGQFDWSVLHAPEDTEGVDRLWHQYIRANIDPWECCVGSPPATTQLRPSAGGSGIDNLVLSGAWIHSGLNATSVECAVMTGMSAARAAGGLVPPIIGENFMATPRPDDAPAPVPYPETRKFGQQIGVPPGVCEDAVIYSFTIAADADKCNATAARWLNRGDYTYETIGPMALVTYLNCTLYSTGDTLGWLEDNEAALWLVLLERVAGVPTRIVFWNPYLVVDTPMAMASGRNIWGFRKTVGPVTIPTDPATATSMSASAILFETLDRNTQGVMQPFISAEKTGDTPITTGDFGVACDWLWHGIQDFAHLIEVALLEELIESMAPALPVVNFRAFPQVGQPHLCALAELCEVHMAISDFTDGGLLGDWSVTLAKAESCDLAEQLGVPVGEPIPALMATWMKCGFTMDLGNVMWSGSDRE